MNPVDPLLGAVSNATAQPLKILFVLTLLSILPAIVMTMTGFVRTVVVLSFLRQGLGTQQAPPPQIVIGLAIFITVFTMAPIYEEVRQTAIEPYQRGTISDIQALETGSIPLRNFMLRQTRQQDLELFYVAARLPLPDQPDDVPMKVAIPAFVVSELTTAFQMGVIILLPFLVIDIAVATITMAMGMVMVSPQMLSLPIKILLFVLADGWNLVVGSLLQSFR
ncbi:MAG: flagellar type III secretion system pore protein FliP [Myxococcales bacterium]|jgi:flagellar biosynthetic protein FliP